MTLGRLTTEQDLGELCYRSGGRLVPYGKPFR